MQKNYQPSLEMILHHEGQHVNHPRDPELMKQILALLKECTKNLVAKKI